jgi:hypothetical protein
MQQWLRLLPERLPFSLWPSVLARSHLHLQQVLPQQM